MGSSEIEAVGRQGHGKGHHNVSLRDSGVIESRGEDKEVVSLLLCTHSNAFIALFIT
jgi:hypothetical protein